MARGLPHIGPSPDDGMTLAFTFVGGRTVAKKKAAKKAAKKPAKKAAKKVAKKKVAKKAKRKVAKKK